MAAKQPVWWHPFSSWTDGFFGIFTQWDMYTRALYTLTRRCHGMSGGMGPGYQLPSLGLSLADALSLTLAEAEALITLLEREQGAIIKAVGGKSDYFNKDPDGFAP